MPARTVVFGLDGACFDLLEPWLDGGRLPTLAGLIDRGGSAPLSSCVPATTPPAWTSLTTGVNPGKHGVFGFYARQRGGYDLSPVTDRDVHARRLWDYTTEAGHTALVVNVPVTHPPRPLDGALVPGYLAPDRPDAYPGGLLDDLAPDYRVYADSEADDVPEPRLLEEWLALTDSRRDLALALADRFEWDLLFVEFQKTDGAVHKFTDRERVREVYERVDACMDDVLAAVDGDPNVFVVSDHGIGQPKEWSVALNTWLVEEGYAETTTGAGRETSWLADATGGDGDPGRSPVGGLLAALGSVGLTKQRLERLLSAAGLYDLLARHLPAGTGDALASETVDRSASTAFYEAMGFSGVDVGVLLNDERLYPDGRVSAASYDAVREELVAALSGLTGPDGRPAFRRVRTREQVYHGPRTGDAPDIVLEQSPDYVIGSADPRPKTFIPAPEGRIDHTREGLLVAAGPDVEAGWRLPEPPSVTDVTPTLLHLLGVPLAERFDGAPLSILAVPQEPAVRDYGPFDPGDSVGTAPGEEAALRERLRGMGYLE